MKNLIDIKQLSKNQILDIFQTADEISKNSKKKNRQLLKGKIVANLFFENSTRTLISFELAAKKLGAHVINVNIDTSSTSKGETLRDTIKTLEAMDIDAFIVRHSENKICDEIQSWLKPKTVLINAGDGNNQHPTQALLDVYTMLKYKSDLSEQKITIIGDIKHSRVANSLIDCLNIIGNTNTNIFGPEQLLPEHLQNVTVCNSIEQALDNADIIVMLRIQKERMKLQNIPNLEEYHNNFGLNRKNLSHANQGCIVMHPGPINRDVEISSEIAYNSPSVILEQVKNGVTIRMAVLAKLLSKKF
ncbi:MAG TPA: aspartate carbamoyltransferase catalytic subunit [Gammaproteobacteria bacterium]|nr:aspartate carbamoyltransferase catalytic subunit [Xanthomonadales bacterium]HPQ86664.1 aspartate carbamoyltransferase catalytic subunit [Gammaproteobacteria bacterium]